MRSLQLTARCAILPDPDVPMLEIIRANQHGRAHFG